MRIEKNNFRNFFKREISTKISRRRKRIIAAIFALFFNTPYRANIWSTSPPKKPKKKGKFEIALKFRVHGNTLHRRGKSDCKNPKPPPLPLSLLFFSCSCILTISQHTAFCQSSIAMENSEAHALGLRDRRPDALGNFRALPDDLICDILEYLTPRDVARLASVSRFFNPPPLFFFSL